MHNTGHVADAPSVKFSFGQSVAANIRRTMVQTSNSADTQRPVRSQEVASSPGTGSAATKLTGQREGSSALGVDSRQVKSSQNRHGKPPLPPAKDRRRTTASSSTAMSPKKTSTLTSDKAECCGWTAGTASRRHQQQKQHHRKKVEASSASQVAFQPPTAQCGVLPGAASSAPGPAPIFTAVPATGVLLHGALPVNARGCRVPYPGGVLQHVDASLTRHHQRVLVAEQPAAAPHSHLYRQGPLTAGPASNAAGWGYAAATPAVARPQPAVCREYLLFGPSSVFLLR